jgi:hypothetical protein
MPPEVHVVGVVNRVMEELDQEPIENEQKGGGVRLRQVANVLREDVDFMLVSGNYRPDFRSINRFWIGVMREGLGGCQRSAESLIEVGGRACSGGANKSGGLPIHPQVWRRGKTEWSLLCNAHNIANWRSNNHQFAILHLHC